MGGNLKFGCLAGSLSVALACGTSAAHANRAPDSAAGGATAPEVWDARTSDFRDLTVAGARRQDAPLRLSKNIVLRAGRADTHPTMTGGCGLPVVASVSRGRCPSRTGERYDVRTYAIAIDFEIDEDLAVYAKTGRSYRLGAEPLRAVGTIGGVDTSFGDRQAVRFEHEVGIKGRMLDRRVTLNLAGYYNKVNSFQPVRTLTTPTGARFSNFVNPTALRNMGLEADLTVIPAQGLALYGSVATNHEKFKICAGGYCPGHARDIIQAQYNAGVNYRRALDFGTLNVNVNYNWTGRGHVATDSVAGSSAASGAFSSRFFRGGFVRRSAATLDARLSLTAAGAPLELFAYGRNLTDQRFQQRRRRTFVVPDSALWNNPLTIGAGVAMVF